MEDLQQKIVQSTEALFLKFGIRSITMDEIARHLAISKKTLYQHFTDKDALVEAFSTALLTRKWNEYKGIMQSSANWMEEMWKMSLRIRTDADEINPTLLHDMQKFHPRAWKLWQDFKLNQVKDALIGSLERGKQEGFVRPEIDPAIVTELRMALIELVDHPEHFPRERFNRTDVHLQIFEVFLFGIATDAGRAQYREYQNSYHQNVPNS